MCVASGYRRHLIQYFQPDSLRVSKQIPTFDIFLEAVPLTEGCHPAFLMSE